MSSHETMLLGPGILTGTPYWPKLHALILSAYKPTRPNWPLPPGFQRLDADVSAAGNQLCTELGPESMVALAFDSGDEPIGCAAIQRFKVIRQSDVDGPTPAAKADSTGESGVAEDKSVREDQEQDPPLWEINLVTTSLTHRNRGVAAQLVKRLEDYIVYEQRGEVQLMVRTVDEISGDYWRKRDFTTAEEHCITLPRGFSHVANAPEDLRLQRDVFLWTGKKVVENQPAEDLDNI